MKVIGAGFGGAGTMSLKAALEELGVDPCYHVRGPFDDAEHVRLWQTVARGKPVDWKELFETYQVTVDWPGCTSYKELMEA